MTVEDIYEKTVSEMYDTYHSSDNESFMKSVMERAEKMKTEINTNNNGLVEIAVPEISKKDIRRHYIMTFAGAAAAVALIAAAGFMIFSNPQIMTSPAGPGAESEPAIAAQTTVSHEETSNALMTLISNAATNAAVTEPAETTIPAEGEETTTYNKLVDSGNLGNLEYETVVDYHELPGYTSVEKSFETSSGDEVYVYGYDFNGAVARVWYAKETGENYIPEGGKAYSLKNDPGVMMGMKLFDEYTSEKTALVFTHINGTEPEFSVEMTPDGENVVFVYGTDVTNFEGTTVHLNNIIISPYTIVSSYSALPEGPITGENISVNLNAIPVGEFRLYLTDGGVTAPYANGTSKTNIFYITPDGENVIIVCDQMVSEARDPVSDVSKLGKIEVGSKFVFDSDADEGTN